MTYQECVQYQKEIKAKIATLEAAMKIAKETNVDKDQKEEMVDAIDLLLEHWYLEEIGVDEYIGRKVMDAQDIQNEMELE